MQVLLVSGWQRRHEKRCGYAAVLAFDVRFAEDLSLALIEKL